MTEEEWLSNDSLTAAFYSLEPTTTSVRKLRLFVISYLRASLHLFPDDAVGAVVVGLEQLSEQSAARHAIPVAARHLEVWNQGESPHMPVWRAIEACGSAPNESGRAWGAYLIAFQQMLDAHVRHHEILPSDSRASELRWAVQLEFLHLFRDIVGNPFRPVAFDPRWRTEHTVGIAAKMYEDRDFRAMPILADALEEAGCENADILAHCREPGVHVRGCWVVDLVLGKS